MKKNKLLILAITLISFSCTKLAGTGGSSVIKGKIVVNNIDKINSLVDVIKLKVNIFIF